MRIGIVCSGLIWLCLALAGCATDSSMLLVSRTDRQMAKGTVDWLVQRASVSLNDRIYQGDYILTPSPQTTVIINNNEDKKKEGRHSTTSTPRSTNGTGKLLLLSSEGDALHCEFTYEENLGMKAIGVCTDATHHKYDLQITTAF